MIDLFYEEATTYSLMLIAPACIGIQNFRNGLRSCLYRDTIALGRAPSRTRKSAEPSFLRLTLAGCCRRLSSTGIAGIAISAGISGAADCALSAGTRCASPEYCCSAAYLD